MKELDEKSKKNQKTKNCFLSFFYQKKSLWTCWFILFLSVFLILFVQGINSLDPDLGWHLRVGKDIAQSGSVPRIESYTFPTEGDSWVDHEWLSNLFLYRVHESSSYGFWFLSAFMALMAVITFILTVFLTKKIVFPKINPWKYFFYSSLLIFPGTYSLLSAFGVRLQVITWLFTILLLSLFILFHQQKKYWTLFVAPLLLGLWANTHGTFVTGLFCFIAFALFFLFLTKRKFEQKIFVFFSLLVSVLFTLLTPYSFQLWKLVFEEYTQNRGYLTQIKEWLPMYAAPYIHWYSALFISLFLAILAIGLLSKVIPKKRSVLIYLAFVAGLLLLSVQSRRFLPLFTFTSFPISVFVLVNIYPAIIKKWHSYILCLVFLFFILIKIEYIKTVPPNLFEQNIETSPYQAMLFLKDRPEFDDLNLYNQYGWGGYLDWMWPEKKLFIDGRMPQKPMPNGQTYIDEYLAFRQADKMIIQLRKYRIKLVLIPPSKPYKQATGLEKHLLEEFFLVNLEEFNKEDPLYEYLHKNWQQIYSDEVALIYLHPEIEYTQ